MFQSFPAFGKIHNPTNNKQPMNGKALDFESRDCRSSSTYPCWGHIFSFFLLERAQSELVVCNVRVEKGKGRIWRILGTSVFWSGAGQAGEEKGRGSEHKEEGLVSIVSP